MNKIYLFLVFSILTTIGMAQEKIKQTAGRDQLGTFAPKFAELNDDVLFGEVWSRTDRLGLRDRNNHFTHQSGDNGQFADIPFAIGPEQRHYPNRDCRDYHAHRFLCGLAESLGCVPACQGSVGRRYER